MAVRFLPASEERPERARARKDLAEVIELRSLLKPASALRDGGSGAGSLPSLGVGSSDGQAPVEPLSAQAEGVRLLSRKAQSSGELHAALLALGHDLDAVESVIAEFERSLYLDDAGLARMVAEKLRSSKQASRAQIRAKLRGRKLPDAVIERVLAEFDDGEEFELLRAAAEQRARRLTGLDRQTAERRLLGFLQRRGWAGEPAFRAAREALDGVA